MAVNANIAVSSFVNIKRAPLGPGMWQVTGKIDAITSYTGTGEVITNAMWLAATGTRRIISMQIAGAVIDSSTPVIDVVFDHTPTTGNQGKLKLVNGTRAHAHPALDTTPQLARSEAGATSSLGTSAMYFTAICQ